MPVLHLPQLLLQRLGGPPQALYLDGLGLKLPPELVRLLPAGSDGVVAPAGLHRQVGELALVPLLGGLQVLGRHGLVLAADLLEGGGEVRLGHLHLHGHLRGLDHLRQLGHLLFVHLPQEVDLVQEGLDFLLQVQAHHGGVVHVLLESLEGGLRLLPGAELLLVLLPEFLQVVVDAVPLYHQLGLLSVQLLQLGAQLSDLLLVDLRQAGRLCLPLAQRHQLGLQHFVVLLQVAHLLDEHGKAVIETLHLLLLVGADDLVLIVEDAALGQVEGLQRSGEGASRLSAVGAHGGDAVASSAGGHARRRGGETGRIPEDPPVGGGGEHIRSVAHLRLRGHRARQWARLLYKGGVDPLTN